METVMQRITNIAKIVNKALVNGKANNYEKCEETIDELRSDLNKYCKKNKQKIQRRIE